jgi:hypothetical protein
MLYRAIIYNFYCWNFIICCYRMFVTFYRLQLMTRSQTPLYSDIAVPCIICLLFAVVWYAFVVLNTLQGLFIFLAFTCTQKVWRGLCAQLGLRRDQQTQGTKSTLNTGTAATWT